MSKKKLAVVLSGCGVYDGSEIHEAVATLLAIDKLGASYQCFAPDIKQHHVINHFTGEEMNESRNVLVESARIARGQILPLSDLNIEDIDGLVFPGGFGAAKNLCSYAVDGTKCLINSDVNVAVRDAYERKIPIAALCVSPVLIAEILANVTLTIGLDETTANDIESMGAIHEKSEGSEIVIDQENKIVTSPCYMLDSSISVVAQGAENAIKALLEMMN